MKHTPSISRKALYQTVFYTVLFSLLAHGYRFLNMSFSGDAAQISQAEEVAYQISIGRFFQPVLWQIRGTITAPLTIGLFATAALAGATILVITMLGFEDRFSILLTCGILATNETLSVSYATYLPWVDVYMIAFFFAMCGVYVGVRYRYGHLLSPVFYCFSLGLYQSYIQAAAAMIILLFILRLLNGECPGIIWAEGIKSCLAILAGLLLYAAALNMTLSLLNISAFDDYNSVNNVLHGEFNNIAQLLFDTFIYPLSFFTRAADSAFIPPQLTLTLLILGAAAFVIPAHRLKFFSLFTLAFLLVIAPLGVNFVAFISQGVVHPLMVYSFYFIYILFIALWTLPSTTPIVHSVLAKLVCLGRHIVMLLIILMLSLNVLTSNQLYLRRDLEFYSTTSAATRILKHADSIEGYIPGETPVCILGYLPSSKIGFVRPGFESLSNLQGMRYTYAAAYEISTPWYFQMILGYPINFVHIDDQYLYRISDIGDSIPSFPDENCYRMIDGILFIKLS